jgi:hypothetical protein
MLKGAYSAVVRYKIIQALRKVYFQVDARKQVMERNRRSVPKYNKDGSRSKRDRVERSCEVCGSWVMTKEFQVDHLEPVVRCDWESKDIGGKISWDTYIARLFCSSDNLKGMCVTCHSEKTKKERALRKMWRDFRAGKCEQPKITYMGNDFTDYDITEAGWIVKK